LGLFTAGFYRKKNVIGVMQSHNFQFEERFIPEVDVVTLNPD
jgi:hypothetical protein